MRPTHRLLTIAGLLVTACAVGVSGSSSLAAISLTDGTYALDMPLSKPTTIAPENHSALTYPTNPIKLSWRPVPGAGSYEVQVAQQPTGTVDCSENAAWQSENILFTYTTDQLGWVPELTDKATGSDIWTGTFCWRVRAAGGSTPGTWSSSSKFTVSWPARPTNLKFFADESGDIPRAAGTAGETTGFDTGYLEWDAIPGASRYEVQISESPTFSSDALFATKTYFGNRMLLPQMPDNNYSWRVRPVAGNGVTGSWSEVSTFTIQRDTRYWTSVEGATYPAQGQDVDDLRFGYEPVPGASYYRYMVSTDPTTFTELDSNGAYGAVMDSETCTFGNFRLSSADEAKSSTINSWVSMAGMLDPEVVKNLSTWCEFDHDADDATPLVNVLPDLPDTIYWRVYPVWQLSSSTESGWTVPTRKVVGSSITRSFDLTPYTAALIADPAYGPVSGSQCRRNPAPAAPVECLRLRGGSMSPLNSTIHSSSMQVPYFEWGAYPGVYPAHGAGPGSFRVQVARDSGFNNQVIPQAANNLIRGWMSALGPAKMSERAASSAGLFRFGSINRSFALTTGLPDEGQDGNGYFWRAIPCQSAPGSATDGPYLCSPDFYSDETDDIWSPGMRYGQPSSGALEFRKRVEVSTQVVADFAAGMPLLKVGPVGASSFADWQRGIQGADHYEFELSRSQTFEDSRVLKTTVPRIVPWGATPADLLEPGTWFWRVRAVDRDGLTGTWSGNSSFAVGAAAPAVAGDSATSGVGATVQWSPVAGATSYEVAWSTNSSFSGATVKETRQTAYHIPSSAPGSYVWRVRAKTGASSYGSWSAARAVTILAPTRIPIGVSRDIVNAGSTSIIEGQLVIAGSARNGQIVMLQRKASACDGGGGYRRVTAYTSGRRLDDGMVRFRIRVNQSSCYRLAWDHANGTVYSASFAIGARPVVAFRPTTRTVKRGREFCSVITSRQPLTGTLQVQYQIKKTWVNARTVKVRGMKRRVQCAAINRGGRFPVRVALTALKHPRNGSTMYEDTYVSGGTIRTNDTFVVIR